MTEREEELAESLTARGYRAVASSGWDRQMALDTVHEQRRRQAGNQRLERYASIGGTIAEEVARRGDLSAHDAATALLFVAGLLGTACVLNHFSGLEVVQILSCAADDLDRHANSGEQT